MVAFIHYVENACSKKDMNYIGDFYNNYNIIIVIYMYMYYNIIIIHV